MIGLFGRKAMSLRSPKHHILRIIPGATMDT